MSVSSEMNFHFIKAFLRVSRQGFKNANFACFIVEEFCPFKYSFVESTWGAQPGRVFLSISYNCVFLTPITTERRIRYKYCTPLCHIYSLYYLFFRKSDPEGRLFQKLPRHMNFSIIPSIGLFFIYCFLKNFGVM